MIRVVFIGSVDMSEALLKALLKVSGISVVGIVTKESSTFNSDFLSLVPLALANNIDSFIYSTSSKDLMDEWVLSKKPDLVYCFGWSHLLGEKLLKKIPMGVVGYHPAALPANRGRHPIVWALALGLHKTASTFFIMDGGADSGDIISQKPVKITLKDDAATLYEKFRKVAQIQVMEFSKAFVAGRLKKKKQNHSLANTWRKRSAIDGLIDWRMGSQSILNLIRALTKPYVGAGMIFEGREIKVWKAWPSKLKNKPNIEPGKIIKYSGSLMVVKTGDGFIEIELTEKISAHVGDYL